MQMPSSKKLPKTGRSTGQPNYTEKRGGDVMPKGGKGTDTNAGKTTSGNVLRQATQPKEGEKYGSDSDYSLGSLTKKSTR